jgi:hypothetical protein
MSAQRYALRDDQWSEIKDLMPRRAETVGVTGRPETYNDPAHPPLIACWTQPRDCSAAPIGLWGDDQRESRGDDHATGDSTHVY